MAEDDIEGSAKYLHCRARLAILVVATNLGAIMTASGKRGQDRHTLRTGRLDVGNGHKVFFEEWGNPTATPILHLHGGPGSGCKPHHKSLYDPMRQRVIFHDQRGSGRSRPFAETRHNRTSDLILDIERLRACLGIDQAAYVAGGSWGSTLALSYAIAHPDRVRRLVLWGIYLGRTFEDDFVNAGKVKYVFPEAWNRFIAMVPRNRRRSGKSIMAYYASGIRSNRIEVSNRYADEWILWGSTLASSAYDQQHLERDIINARKVNGRSGNYGAATIQTLYFRNGCFIRNTPLLKNVSALRHIPCSVVQGRFDLCTPAISAYQLSRAYGDSLHLQWVNSGHSATPEMLAVLRATIAANFDG